MEPALYAAAAVISGAVIVLGAVLVRLRPPSSPDRQVQAALDTLARAGYVVREDTARGWLAEHHGELKVALAREGKDPDAEVFVRTVVSEPWRKAS